jgi:hypothetical protein
VTGVLTAVDVQDLPNYKACGFEERHRIDDVPNLAHPTDRMKLRERLVRAGRIPRRLDDAGAKSASV